MVGREIVFLSEKAWNELKNAEFTNNLWKSLKTGENHPFPPFLGGNALLAPKCRMGTWCNGISMILEVILGKMLKFRWISSFLVILPHFHVFRAFRVKSPFFTKNAFLRPSVAFMVRGVRERYGRTGSPEMGPGTDHAGGREAETYPAFGGALAHPPELQ